MKKELLSQSMKNELASIDLIIEDLQTIKKLVDDNNLMDYLDRVNYRWNLRVLISQANELIESTNYVLNRFEP